jgi:hypothetical protein
LVDVVMVGFIATAALRCSFHFSTLPGGVVAGHNTFPVAGH